MPTNSVVQPLTWMLTCTALVLLMQAGFACLETGLVRAKNSINVAIKNVVDFCIASIIYWIFGYGLMFGDSAMGWFGTSQFLFDGGRNTQMWIFFLFQLTFCGTATTIISGAVAERMRFSGYLLVSVLISSAIYPIIGHWVWNGNTGGLTSGWLHHLGFLDFAGATVVHSTAGWVALAAILVIGPRLGRFGTGTFTIHGHNIPLSALGLFLIFVGWMGFNGGSVMQASHSIPLVLVNTVLASAAGGLAALAYAWRVIGRPDVCSVINGILAGLVAITASAPFMTPAISLLVGGVGGVLCIQTTRILEQWHVDDVIGAIPAHACAGVWGTLALAVLGNPELWGTGHDRLTQFGIQLTGTIACFIWAFGFSFVILKSLNRFIPLRVSEDEERLGLNMTEHGASTEHLDLLGQMATHREQGDLTQLVEVEPHTEVGQIATEYNRVLERVNAETHQREEAIQALRESQEEIRLIIDHALDAIVTIDQEGMITDWNPQATLIFGWPKSEILGQNFRDALLPLSQRTEQEQQLKHFLDTKQQHVVNKRLEIRGLHRKGHKFPMEITMVPLFKQNSYSFCAFIRDITEQKETEAALGQETALMQVVQQIAIAANEAQSVNDAFQSSLDRICTFTKWPVAHVYFRDDEQTPQLWPSKLWHLDNVDEFQTFKSLTEQTVFDSGVGLPGRVLAQGRAAWIPDITQDLNFPRARMAGELGIRGGFAFPVLIGNTVMGVLEFFSRSIETPNERLLEVMEIIGTQLGRVLERKRGEQAREESDARIRGIVDTAADAIITINEDGIIQSYNSAAEHVFGYTAQEAISQNVSLLMPSPYQKEHDGYLRRYLEGHASSIFGRSRELVGERKDGARFPMELAVSETKVGVRRTFTGIVRDISDRKQHEQELREAKEHAESAAIAKSQFLATMSHEIRTPMNGVIGMTGLLLETDLSPQQHQFAETVRSSGETLLKIINDILDFSKVEAGRFNLEGVDFEISDLVEETLGLFEAVAMKKGLKIEAKIEKSVPKIVSADINKIRQILNNLLNNGIKFTSKGRVSLQVSSIASEKDSEMLKFAVSDTGIGIQKEIQSNLFQPFQQADSSTTRLFGGTGLGLAICKKFVELMNGEIGVESEIDKGSTFWFTIEAKIPTHEKAKEELVDSNPVSLTEVKNSDLKVLVVEDNFINREITTKMLEQIGLRAKCVENGLESLNSVSDEAFDLVLMDCQMPVMDGFEATKKIRANSKLEKQPKIIALTASSAIEDSIKCLEVGMDDYLPKPFTKNDLAGLVASHFGLESPSKNLDFEGDFIQHSLSDIIKPATLENFREIESNGDNQFTKEILVLFSKHTEEQLDEIWVLFSGNDFDGIKRRAHNLKGSSANVGIERLHKRFENMEQQAEQGDVKAIEEQIRLAFIEFKETKNIILGL